MQCTYCGSERKNINSLKNHELRCSQNPSRIVSKIDYSKIIKKRQNQYTKAERLGLPKPISPCKGRPGNVGFKHTQEFKDNQRKVALRRKLGGITQSRWIDYNGKKLGSSYELKVVESLDDNGIRWDTCGRLYYTDDTGKRRSYTPDIYLPDYDVYLDPKNDFLIDNINPSLGFSDKQKIQWVSEQNEVEVFILNKHQLTWKEIQKLIAPVV